MQVEQHIDALPDSPLAASASFFAEHLERSHALISGDAEALAIILPAAGTDHDNWRRALARDLAREYAPKRVNIVGANQASLGETLAYLADAPGVTGQYCPLHG